MLTVVNKNCSLDIPFIVLNSADFRNFTSLILTQYITISVDLDSSAFVLTPVF